MCFVNSTIVYVMYFLLSLIILIIWKAIIANISDVCVRPSGTGLNTILMSSLCSIRDLKLTWPVSGTVIHIHIDFFAILFDEVLTEV